MTLPLGIHHRDRDCRLMNAQPNSFSLLIEGAPFVGDHANVDNLVQKGRSLIMRLHQLITSVEFWVHCPAPTGIWPSPGGHGIHGLP